MPPFTDPGVTGRKAFTSDGTPRPNDFTSPPLPARDPPGIDALELERIVTLGEVARLTGLSEDSVRRHHAHLIRHLSPRRIGMKLKDALSIGSTA